MATETTAAAETTERNATELTFSAGQRAVLDLRDSSGAIALKDWDEPTIRIATEGSAAPFVLRDGDTFRITIQGGTVTLPAGLPTEVRVPAAVQLRMMRVMRAGGETTIHPVAGGGSAPGTASDAEAEAVDLDEFAREMSQTARRIFERMTEVVRSGNHGFADDVARRLDEAAERVEEQAQRIAERVQQEVERANSHVVRAQDHARKAAARAEEHAQRAAERIQRRAERRAMRHEERFRAGPRGRWWFTERYDQPTGGPAAGSQPASAANPDEQRAILAMLSEGKISAEQAAKLLDALG